MTPETIAQITTERLGEWGEKAIESHATPVLMLSVGHDDRVGELGLYICDGVSDADLLTFLTWAQRAIAQRIVARHFSTLTSVARGRG